MSLILKQQPANSIPNPPAGKGTLFLNDSGAMQVRQPDGNIASFPTASAGNTTQVMFNDNGSIGQDTAFTYNKTSNTLTTANLTVTGTLSAGDISVSSIANGTSNVDIIGTSGNVTVSVAGNANILSVTGTGVNVAGTLNATGNTTLSNLTVTGTLDAGDITVSSIANGTSNVDIIGVGGNVTTSVGGNANILVVTGTGANIAGTISTSGNANVGNIGTGGLITATGNIQGGNLKTIGLISATGNVTASSVLANGTIGNGVVAGALTQGSTQGTGVRGQAYVTNSGDTGAAVGIRGYAVDTHAGGYNIGVLGNAIGSGVGNYAFYVQNGGIASIENTAFWDLYDNSQTALVWQSSGKANILGLDTTNGAEGVYTNGYLNVTGNANVGGIKTDNYYYSNGTPVDFQQAGGSNQQVQFNDSDGFGGSSAFVFNKSSNVLSLNGTANVKLLISDSDANLAGNLNALNAGLGGFLTVVGTITGGNIITGGTISATGNANIGNIGTGGLITATGNIRGANLITGGVVSATGNGTFGNVSATTFTGNLSGNATTAGTVVTAAQPNITRVGTLTSISVSGNANVGNLGTGGLITATGNLNAGNVITGGVVSATGNGTFGNVSATLFTGNLSGNATTAGTVVTAAQPNITRVGTLTSISVSGNANVGNLGTGGLITATGNLNAGNVITGGVVSATGNGTFGNVSATLFTGNVSGTGNSNVGNLGASGLITATGNITGANLVTPGVLSVTSNANIGNIGTGGLITATGNITGANIITGGVVSATGNGTFGNVTATTFTGTLSGAATTAGTVTTAAQPNITSVGTLTGLTVNGNITAGNVNASALVNGNSNVAIPAANGNVVINSAGNVTLTVSGTGANITGTANVSGNANVGNLGTATLIATTGNITTVNSGLLQNGTSNVILAASGNVTTTAAGNATLVVTGTGANITGTANISGNVSTAGILTVSGTGISSIAGNLNMNNKYINNVTDPVLNQDVATKAYVDQQISTGIAFHQPVNAATTTTLAIATGGTVTYNNGASGVGANLVTTGSFNLIDTANIQTVGARILVKNEANATWNGIYTYANTTTIVRATDADEYGPDSVTQLSLNDYFYTQQGNVNLGTAFVVSAPTGTITFGTSNITFATFSTSQVYSNGTGLGLSGTVFSIANTAVTAGSYGNGDSVPTYTVNGQGQLTAAANVAITANAGNLSGTVLKSTVVTSSLTSVGTLGNLSVTSNISGGNATITANTSSGNLVVGGPTPDTRVTIYGVGQSAIYSLGGNSTTTGTDIHISGADSTQTRITQDSFGNSNSYVAFTGRTARGSAATPLQSQTNDVLAQFTGRGFSNGSLQFGNVSTGRLDVVAAENFTDTSRATNVLIYTTPVGAITPTATATFGSTGNLTITGSFIGAIAAGSNTISTTGNANVGNIGAAAGVFTTVAGSLTTAAQPNITSVGTLTSLGVSGAVTASTLVSNVATGTAPLTVTSTTRVGNLNVAYANVSDYSAVSTATTGNYYLNFVNALTGNVQEYANSVFVANVSNGAITATTFVGALSGAATSATTAGTVTTAAQGNITSVGTLTSLNSSGTITAPAFTANTGVFTGNGSGLSAIAGANVTGTVSSATSASSATTAGTVTTAAQPNVTSLGTLSSLSVTGNINAGNVIATYYGAATGLTSIPGANITGTIPSGVVPTLNQNTSGYAATVSDAAQGNITSVGTLTSLSVSGTATVGTVQTTTLTTGANTTAGTVTGNWTLSAGSKWNATYADLSEKYVADSNYGPGTVLIFGGEHEVTLSDKRDNTKVAGVVTTDAAYTMNSGLEAEFVADIALQGRVPCKVIGPIIKGDLLVSAENGYAIANNEARAGTIIGKSLQNFDGATGVIEVAVGRF